MGFVFNDFGLLADVSEDFGFIWITNFEGEKRKMSKSKYKESAIVVLNKAKSLLGKEVRIQTSQNTNIWNSNEWFSDIMEA